MFDPKQLYCFRYSLPLPSFSSFIPIRVVYDRTLGIRYEIGNTNDGRKYGCVKVDDECGGMWLG